MKDQRFCIYNRKYEAFFGDITDGCLHLESDVDGDGNYPDSEMHYNFTREDTEKLFEIISLEDFIKFCREKNLIDLGRFLEENDIHPKTCVI